MSEPISRKKIPFCPMLSCGANGNLQICLQEKCAWWMSSTKSCAMFVVAHNNILDIKSKQGKYNVLKKTNANYRENFCSSFT